METDIENKEEKTQEAAKVATVRVKLLDKIQVKHSGKIYHTGDVIEMTKPEADRLGKICTIQEVKK